MGGLLKNLFWRPAEGRIVHAFGAPVPIAGLGRTRSFAAPLERIMTCIPYGGTMEDPCARITAQECEEGFVKRTQFYAVLGFVEYGDKTVAEVVH